MGRKEPAPPKGADVFYSRLVRCEPRHGLVLIEVSSGQHTERGLVPISIAIQLHHALGAVINTLMENDAIDLEAARTGHH